MFRHLTFSRPEVIMLTNTLTNKQTPLKTSTSLRYATPVGKKPYLLPYLWNGVRYHLFKSNVCMRIKIAILNIVSIEILVGYLEI